MRIIFMGSPELAVPSFRAIMETGSVVGVVTQPAKASGRGRKLTPSPVYVEAAGADLKIMTPDTLRTPDVIEMLRELDPDLAVVVAYGKILPPGVLSIPRLGCVNIHASLLPELRGAAPIQWAIARGFTKTGVTLMQMDEGMDSGPILLQKETVIAPEETAGELGKRLAEMGAELLREGLGRLEKQELVPIEQDTNRATYAPLLTKEDGLIDWALDSEEIFNRVRGFSPWPGTYSTRAGSRILVTRALALDEPNASDPGTITAAGPSGIHVSCGAGTLNILRVKPEGKREMEVGEFLSGYRIQPGEILGQKV